MKKNGGGKREEKNWKCERSLWPLPLAEFLNCYSLYRELNEFPTEMRYFVSALLSAAFHLFEKSCGARVTYELQWNVKLKFHSVYYPSFS